MEIPLYVHAALASAKIIFNKRPILNSLTFKNIEGLALYFSELSDANQMTFPVYDTIP